MLAWLYNLHFKQVIFIFIQVSIVYLSEAQVDKLYTGSITECNCKPCLTPSRPLLADCQHKDILLCLGKQCIQKLSKHGVRPIVLFGQFLLLVPYQSKTGSRTVGLFDFVCLSVSNPFVSLPYILYYLTRYPKFGVWMHLSWRSQPF